MGDEDFIKRGAAYAAVMNNLSNSDALDAIAALPAAPSEDVRAGARIIPMHTHSMYGVCIGGRWDGWVMVKHPDGYWVSHNKPDPIDPAATFNLIPEAKP